MNAVFRALRIGSLTALLAAASVVEAHAAAANGTGASAAGSTGGNGPGSGGATGAGPGGGPNFQYAVATQDGGWAAKTATRAAERSISACRDDDPRCIADALDAYAAALRNLYPSLPPQLKGLPDIVSRAAHRVRQAKTPAQAAVALKAAIAEVHKTIALLEADDPVLLKSETRQGTFVAETLTVAETKLEKVAGL